MNTHNIYSYKYIWWMFISVYIYRFRGFSPWYLLLLQDPYHYDKYLAHNLFLADINNERSQKQQQYKQNMLSLKQLVLVRFADDVLVVPKDSAWFGYWDGHRLLSMNETQLYQVFPLFTLPLPFLALINPIAPCFPHCSSSLFKWFQPPSPPACPPGAPPASPSEFTPQPHLPRGLFQLVWPSVHWSYCSWLSHQRPVLMAYLAKWK